VLAGTSLSPPEQQVFEESSKLGGIVVPDTFSPAARETAKQATAQSFVYACRWAMLTGAALAFGAAIVSTALIRGRAARRWRWTWLVRCANLAVQP